MRLREKIAAGMILALLLCLLYMAAAYDVLEQRMLRLADSQRMKNVVVTQLPESRPVSAEPPEEEALPAMSTQPLSLPRMEPQPESVGAQQEPEPEAAQEEIQETTIRGGLSVKNETAYWVDAAQILSQGPGLILPSEGPQILIIHTHSSEAYTQAGLDRYEPSDLNRTENTEFNIVRVGDELTAILQQAGLRVIHDRGIYDYPSYTGSYTRSGEAVSQYLADYPGIGIVIDMHRDALGSDGVVYKTMAEEEGVCASQVMLLVGTDESGLEHPNWQSNLALALYLQNAVNSVSPTLMRPVDLVTQRFNQHLCPGSLIMEVGSSGNTLQEALAAVRLFGNSAAPALLALTEPPPEE